MVLTYIFLVISEFEHIFMYLAAICVSSLKKKVYSDPLPISKMDYLGFLNFAIKLYDLPSESQCSGAQQRESAKIMPAF